VLSSTLLYQKKKEKKKREKKKNMEKIGALHQEQHLHSKSLAR